MEDTQASLLPTPLLRLGRSAAATLGAAALLAGLFLAVPACQTIRQVANLRSVNFGIDQVERATLAGIDLSQVRSAEDVRVADLGRLGTALARGEMPMRFTLMLNAENPAENGVDARLVEMDWTLLLEGQETVSGTFNENVALPSGQVATVPVEMQLDLLDFFERGGQDLLELALSVAGVGGQPKNVSLRARPTIDTPVGPIRYPRPITINVGEVGGGGTGL